MAFEDKHKISEIDLGWQNTDRVSPAVCVENDDFDKDASALNFAWFKTDSHIKPSPREEQEKIEAMKEQFALKIINKYGLPYGMPLPKEYRKIIEEREKKKGSKFDRQRKRTIDRQIEKDMHKARKQEQQEYRMLQELKASTSLPSPIMQEARRDGYLEELLNNAMNTTIFNSN